MFCLKKKKGIVVEQKLSKVDQYDPAHRNGPLLEKRPIGHIYSEHKNHPYYHEPSADWLDRQQIPQSYPHDPLPGKQTPGFIHSPENHQDLRMDLCLENLNQTAAITIEIYKSVCTSKAQALCLYVLASQSSHDYTQDTYGQRRHSFALKPRYQNKHRSPAQG